MGSTAERREEAGTDTSQLLTGVLDLAVPAVVDRADGHGEGPHRTYHSLDAPGRDRLREATKTWRAFTATMGELAGA